MNRFRLIAISVMLTSVFWVSIGAWLSMPQPAYQSSLTGVEEHAGGEVHPSSRSTGLPPLPEEVAVPGSVDSLLLIPVAGVRSDDLVDSFARSRSIEIPAPPGMPVIAAAPGIVEKLYTSGDGGKMIYVRSPDRTRLYRYAHLGAFASGLSEGQVIGAGDQIGSVGSVRLRFEVLAIMPDRDFSEGKRPINPYPLLGGRLNQSR